MVPQNMLKPSDNAPEFELPNQSGESISLSDFDGQRVTLYFYPKAGSRGCTEQGCAFRDAWDEFEARNIAVLGISADSPEANKVFREEHRLPFDLLSDVNGEVARAYDSFSTIDVRGESKNAPLRNTFIIGPDGNIERVYEDVTPQGHAEMILSNI
jgi:peroxiredoxin Q/BCP